VDVFPNWRHVGLVPHAVEGETDDFPALIAERDDALHHTGIPPLMSEKCDAWWIVVGHVVRIYLMFPAVSSRNPRSLKLRKYG
jgi:hypothetical protein